jgi:hypothetical protein
MSTSMSATWSFSLTRRICCRMRSYYHTNIYWSKRGSPAWANEQPAMSLIAERSVRSEQAVRLLGVSRDPGRHALIGGVGVSVAEVRGSLFGYPPKKLHGFGKRAGCLPHRSERMLDGVRRGHGGWPTTPGNAPCARCRNRDTAQSSQGRSCRRAGPAQCHRRYQTPTVEEQGDEFSLAPPNAHLS